MTSPTHDVIDPRNMGERAYATLPDFVCELSTFKKSQFSLFQTQQQADKPTRLIS